MTEPIEYRLEAETRALGPEHLARYLEAGGQITDPILARFVAAYLRGEVEFQKSLKPPRPEEKYAAIMTVAHLMAWEGISKNKAIELLCGQHDRFAKKTVEAWVTKAQTSGEFQKALDCCRAACVARRLDGVPIKSADC